MPSRLIFPGPPRALSPEQRAERATLRRAAILSAVQAIPVGEVRAYAEVARAAGLARHARLVARVLAEAEVPALPWHRVLRADGRIAFPEGSAQALEQARRLRAEGLRVEGLRVRPGGRAGAGTARSIGESDAVAQDTGECEAVRSEVLDADLWKPE